MMHSLQVSINVSLQEWAGMKSAWPNKRKQENVKNRMNATSKWVQKNTTRIPRYMIVPAPLGTAPVSYSGPDLVGEGHVFAFRIGRGVDGDLWAAREAESIVGNTHENICLSSRNLDNAQKY